MAECLTDAVWSMTPAQLHKIFIINNLAVTTNARVQPQNQSSIDRTDQTHIDNVVNSAGLKCIK